jgi:hypothetical protein
MEKWFGVMCKCSTWSSGSCVLQHLGTGEKTCPAIGTILVQLVLSKHHFEAWKTCCKLELGAASGHLLQFTIHISKVGLLGNCNKNTN